MNCRLKSEPNIGVMRCWQYDPAAPIPTWAAYRFSRVNGTDQLEAMLRSELITVNPGDWILRLKENPGSRKISAVVITNAEFQEHFESCA